MDKMPNNTDEAINEEKKISTCTTSLEPPSKKAKCEEEENVSKNPTNIVVCPVKETENLAEKQKEVKILENEDSSDSVLSSSSCESEKSKLSSERSEQQSGEFCKSAQVVQPTVIDVLRKSANELLNSLQRYYDVK